MEGQKIALLLLGDSSRDARIQNMMRSLRNAGAELHLFDTATRDISGCVHQRFQLPNAVRRYFAFFRRTLAAMRGQHYDAILAGDLFSLPAAVRHARRSTGRVLYDSREIYTALAALAKSPLKQAFWSQIEALHIGNAQHTMVTSPFEVEFIQRRYGVQNVHFIPNYPGGFSAPRKNNRLRQKFGIPEDRQILLYQGVLQAGRGIEQMARIVQRNPRFAGICIGDGPLAKTQPLLHFHPAVDYSALLELSAGADFGLSLVQPLSLSYEHALPNKIFEYALAGLPILASNLPEQKRVCEEFGIGLAVPPDDTAQHIAALEKIKREKIASKNAEIAWQRFRWEVIEADFLALFQ